jgi:hypothetical protein
MFVSHLILLLLAGLASAQTVYLIRHGEKPADGSNGLSAQGLERAQCLRTVFGVESVFDIGYIIAETPKSSKFLNSSYLLTPTTRVKKLTYDRRSS